MKKHTRTRAFVRDVKHLATNENGFSAVEFALIVPILMILSIGIIDFGRVLWIDTTVRHAAREAARYASIRGSASDNPATSDDVKSIAVSSAVGANLKAEDISVEWAPNGAPGSLVTVRISVPYAFLVSGLVPLPSVLLQSRSTRAVF